MRRSCGDRERREGTVAGRSARAGDRKPWPGGYARHNGKGWVYYLYRRGQIERSTGVVDDEELAKLHFNAWQSNPAAYDPRDVRDTAGAPLPFTDDLTVKYLNFCAAPEAKG